MNIATLTPNNTHTHKANGYGGGNWQDDQWQGGTKNPQRDYEKQQRMTWLKNEMDKIHYSQQTLQYDIQNLEAKITSAQNANYQLKNELSTLNYEISQLDTQIATLKGRQAAVKEKLQNPYYKDQWGWLQQERWQIADELSRLESTRTDRYWKKQDVEYKIKSNDQAISWDQTQVSQKKTELFNSNYLYDVYRREYEDLKY